MEGLTMGQCKICGKQIEDGQDICEECKAENIDLDGESDLPEIDYTGLDNYDLPELEGDLLETELAFELTDPLNDLENPHIEIREREIEQTELNFDDYDLPELNEGEEVVANEEQVDTSSDSVEISSELPADTSMELPEDLPVDIPTDGAEDIDTDLPLDTSEDVVDGIALDGLIDEIPLDVPEEPSLVDEEVAVENSEDGLLLDSDLDALLSSSEEDMDLSGLLPEDMDSSSDSGESLELEAEESPGSDIDALLGSLTDGGSVIDSDPSDAGDPLSAMGIDVAMDSDLDAVLEEVPDAEMLAENAEPKPKLSLWKRLFGNIKDEKWQKQKEKEAKAEEERLAKEEAKKAEEEAAAAATEGEGGEGEAAVDPKEAKKAEKLAKKEEKAKRKAEKKAEKERLKELAAEEDDDTGRINRVGAAIVFVFFGAICAGVVIGTNQFSYNNSVGQAKSYFKDEEYTEAYKQLAGLALKHKDMELYEKVKTVMYVNKELNSYRNYTNLRMYAEALDSLVKGLEKYDAHKQEAIDLEVIDDLDKVRNKILEEMKKEYNLSEKQAYKLAKEEDVEKYSKKIFKIADED